MTDQSNRTDAERWIIDIVLHNERDALLLKRKIEEMLASGIGLSFAPLVHFWSEPNADPTLEQAIIPITSDEHDSYVHRPGDVLLYRKQS